MYDKYIFSRIMGEWYRHHSLEIRESTAYNYLKSIRVLSIEFGDQNIKKIHTSDIENFFTHNSESSGSTLQNHFKVLNMTFKYALLHGIIKSNPCTGIRIPKKRCSEIEPFSIQEINAILSTEMPEWLKDSIIIAFRTGMRKGEIFALKWSDIDFENRFIKVNRTQSFTRQGIILMPPKTKSSRRRIDIDKKTFEILSKRHAAAESEFVFANRQNEMLIPFNLCAQFKKICEKANVKPRRFHDLRHSHATMLLSENVHPKIVQERLGHSNISITLDTYSHLVPGMQKAAVNVFEKL